MQTNLELARKFLADYAHQNAVEVRGCLRTCWTPDLELQPGRIIEDGRIKTLGYPAEC